MSVTLAISTMFSVSHQFLNHYLTHIITVVAFKHKTATWCFSSVCVCEFYIWCRFFSTGMMMITLLVGIRRDMPGRPSQLRPQRIFH